MKKNLISVFLFLICSFSIPFFSGCEKDFDESQTLEEKIKKSQISKTDLLKIIKNPYIVDAINKIESNTSVEYLRTDGDFDFEQITKEGEYTTYYRLLEPISTAQTKFKFLTITVDIAGNERAAYTTYTPRYFTVELDARTFTGVVEMSDLNGTLRAASHFENGVFVSQPYTLGALICVDDVEIIIHNCTHGGNHPPGVPCASGYVNDGYYEIVYMQICTLNSSSQTAPMPLMLMGAAYASGGGGLSYNDIKNVMISNLTTSQSGFLYNGSPISQYLVGMLSNLYYDNAAFPEEALPSIGKIVDFMRTNQGIGEAILEYLNTNGYLMTNQNYAWQVINSLSTLYDNLSNEQKVFWDTQLSHNSKKSMTTYLLNNGNSVEGQNFSIELINAFQAYQNEFGNSEITNLFINEYVENLFDNEVIDVSDVNIIAPDCESFNFTNTSSNWQMAAVSNIHFQVTVLTPQGAYVNHIIEYPQPILFGCPRNLSIGNTTITPGIAATSSAKALETSMKETVKKYGNKPVTELLVRIYFEQRLKNNYPLYIPGSRVTIHPTTLPVTPTQYQTNAFGTGNCN